MDRTTIIIVDDETEFLRSAAFALRSGGFGTVETRADSREGLALIESIDCKAVLLDIMMPHLTGRELLDRIKLSKPDLPVIMCTAVNEIEVAVGCIKAGAFDYLLKPVDRDRLLTTVRKALEFGALKEEVGRLSASLLDGVVKNEDVFSPIVTGCDSMRSLFRYIEAVAPTPLPVLVAGETGSGKELVARAIHDASDRTGPFVAVNVAGLDDTLFSDTLFGHERGSFTGAERKREGLVAKAGDGTLFLDEIGDLKIESQVKLLRLIEERSYYPVGADTPLRAECRIVAATNADLDEMLKDGRMRKDLYFRLRSHLIRIPPLRKRPGDISLLAKHFFTKAARELNKQEPTVPPQLFTLLGTYAFPGNVRELRAMVYDAVSQHAGGVLSMDSFKRHLDEVGCMGETPGQTTDEDRIFSSDGKLSFGETLPSLKEAENALVNEALRRSENNQSIAARMLGITPSALNKRINK
jgi:DNA-binding NtrC family response regulator